jgi:hypothetical protein
MAKRKKIAILPFLNSLKEFSPKTSIKDLFSLERSNGGHFGKVKA